MTIQQRLLQKRSEIIALLERFAVPDSASLFVKRVDFLLDCLLNQKDSLFALPRVITILFHVGEDAAANIARAILDVIFDVYDELVVNNEKLEPLPDGVEIDDVLVDFEDELREFDSDTEELEDEDIDEDDQDDEERDNDDGNDQINQPETKPTNIKPTTRSNFYFSPEDEEEIRKISQQSTVNSQQMEEIYQRVAGEIITKLRGGAGKNAPMQQYTNAPIEEEERERRRRRLTNIIIAHLKDARDVLETKEALVKSWKIGGMELSAEDAERVVKEIEKARQALQEELKTLRATSTASRVTRNQDTGPDDASLVTRNALQDLSVPEIEAPKKAEPERGTGNASREETNRITGSALWATGSASRVTSVKPSVDSVASTIPSAFGKAKLMGPVEELGSMSLEDFRKLGSVVDVVRKINDKVELLAVDSLLEKKKGIDAWKRSDVYKLYMLIGTESLEKRMAIADVVNVRQKQNLPTLTVEEFSAIADLNRKISFSS